MPVMDASDRITAYIERLDDWRGARLVRIRQVIRAASPELVEEWKWNTPVWSCRGNVVAVGAFNHHVKINFFQGAALRDPRGLLNAGLEAKESRGIDLGEDDRLDEAALKALVRAAGALRKKAR